LSCWSAAPNIGQGPCFEQDSSPLADKGGSRFAPLRADRGRFTPSPPPVGRPMSDGSTRTSPAAPGWRYHGVTLRLISSSLRAHPWVDARPRRIAAVRCAVVGPGFAVGSAARSAARSASPGRLRRMSMELPRVRRVHALRRAAAGQSRSCPVGGFPGSGPLAGPAVPAATVFLSCRPPARPAAIPERFSSSSLPPSFAQGRHTAVFLPWGTADGGAPSRHGLAGRLTGRAR
jgi:hypothetical protein